MILILRDHFDCPIGEIKIDCLEELFDQVIPVLKDWIQTRIDKNLSADEQKVTIVMKRSDISLQDMYLEERSTIIMGKIAITFAIYWIVQSE